MYIISSFFLPSLVHMTLLALATNIVKNSMIAASMRISIAIKIRIHPKMKATLKLIKIAIPVKRSRVTVTG